jgi:hypothetical protein
MDLPQVVAGNLNCELGSCNLYPYPAQAGHPVNPGAGLLYPAAPITQLGRSIFQHVGLGLPIYA